MIVSYRSCSYLLNKENVVAMNINRISSIFALTAALLLISAQNGWAQTRWANTEQNIKLWTESFGDKQKPAVVLIAGAGASALQWGTKFCEQLAERGYYVVRYDHRDTGLSDKLDFKSTPYSLDDLQQDVLAVMQSHDVKQAHMVGFSMGGYISQLMAINHPEHVATFTSIASTPDHSILINTWEQKPVRRSELEPPTKEILTATNELFGKPATTPDEKVEQMLAFVQLLTGDKVKVDKPFWSQVFYETIEREKSLEVGANHVFAQKSDMCDRRTQLNLVTAPGLAIQGMQDPYFPINHGKKTAEAIPNGHYLAIENMGHAFDPAFWPEMVTALDEHFKRAF